MAQCIQFGAVPVLRFQYCTGVNLSRNLDGTYLSPRHSLTYLSNTNQQSLTSNDETLKKN